MTDTGGLLYILDQAVSGHVYMKPGKAMLANKNPGEKKNNQLLFLFLQRRCKARSIGPIEKWTYF